VLTFTERNRYYEFFKFTHILVSILFVVFFFVHCDFRLSSWSVLLYIVLWVELTENCRDYFIATGAIYLSSVIYAWTKTYLFHGLHTATIRLLSCGMLEITIPTVISWQPGQHIFIRFLTLSLHGLTGHPFTISSAAHKAEICGHPSEMKFYVKAQGGFTARLTKLVDRKPSLNIRVFLEGPYGGISAGTLAQLDRLLVVSGGSGAGFSLGVMDDTIRRIVAGGRLQRLQNVYATRHDAVAEWYSEEIERLTAPVHKTLPSGQDNRISTSIRVTSSKTPSQETPMLGSTSDPEDTEKGTRNTEASPISTVQGAHATSPIERGRRPDLKSIISSTASQGGSLGVIVCGPDSMLHDVRNAVADEQLRLFLKNPTETREIYLHVEHFS
jgi:ferric-chelate reductase